MMATKKKTEPANVNIVDTEKPIDVIVKKENESKKMVDSKNGKTLAPTTTAQEDIVTAGQRRINLIWELTQAIIALMITGAVIYNSINQIVSNEINYAFFLIIAMYFIRTNHQMIGGVGHKTGTR